MRVSGIRVSEVRGLGIRLSGIRVLEARRCCDIGAPFLVGVCNPHERYTPSAQSIAENKAIKFGLELKATKVSLSIPQKLIFHLNMEILRAIVHARYLLYSTLALAIKCNVNYKIYSAKTVGVRNS